MLRFYAINCTAQVQRFFGRMYILMNRKHIVMCNICRDRSSQHTMTGVAGREKMILLNYNAATAAQP